MRRHITHWIAGVLVGTMLFALGQAHGQQAEGAERTDNASELSKLKAEIQQLKEENAQLRNENQLLRRMLTKPAETSSVEPGTVAKPASKTGDTTQVKSTDQQETGYWMTNSSGKRHNRNCRYYKNSNGRFCGPNDGIACKICGG